METMKEKLKRGEMVMVCGMGRVCHHNIVQMLGVHGGFDAVWLDQEHAGLSFETLEIAAMAARAHGMDSFVRLAPTDYATVTRCYEAGAGGIMAAQIESAAQAEEIVQWAKFHPRGHRGLNGSGFDGHYGNSPAAEFCERANRDLFVAIQIETTGALEQCDEIAAIDEVDLLFVGPADLSQNLGITGQFDNPKLHEAIERVAAACKNHGKNWGIVPASPAMADRCVELGCKMLVPVADVKILNAGIRASKEAYAKYF